MATGPLAFLCLAQQYLLNGQISEGWTPPSWKQFHSPRNSLYLTCIFFYFFFFTLFTTFWLAFHCLKAASSLPEGKGPGANSISFWAMSPTPLLCPMAQRRPLAGTLNAKWVSGWIPTEIGIFTDVGPGYSPGYASQPSNTWCNCGLLGHTGGETSVWESWGIWWASPEGRLQEDHNSGRQNPEYEMLKNKGIIANK